MEAQGFWIPSRALSPGLSLRDAFVGFGVGSVRMIWYASKP